MDNFFDPSDDPHNTDGADLTSASSDAPIGDGTPSPTNAGAGAAAAPVLAPAPPADRES